MSARADIWRTGHGRFNPKHPEQLELTPVEIPTPESEPKAGAIAHSSRLNRIVGRVDRLDSTLDAIAARLAALKEAL